MLKTHYLNYRHVSSDPNLIAKAEQLATQYRAAKQQVRKNNRDFETAFYVILTNVEGYQAYDGYSLYIPTNNNLFSGKYKRNATYTPEIRDALKWLIAEGYLEKVAKLTRPEKKGSKERLWLPFAYKLSSKWLAEIAAAPLSDPSKINRNPLASYWQLREDRYDKKGNKYKVAIEPTDEQLELNAVLLAETNKTLAAYDDFMTTIATTIGSNPVHPAQLSLTRVFSKGAFELGGRLYAPIQNYTKDNRKYYHFDGDPTIEIDYSSIHPHMLYHKEVLEFDGDDPYTIEGFDRGAVKLAFNIMLNRKAVGANKSAAKTISKEVGCDGDAAEALEAAIQALHSPIAHHFNTGVGLTLQRLDSDIALFVINHFITALKRPILCIHDSFIVSVRDTESLILAMESSYRQLLGDDYAMRSIKADALDFNEALTVAINRCFEQDTDDLDNEKWDELIAEQGITDCTVIDVNDHDVDE